MLKNDEFIMEIVDVTNEGSGVGKVDGMAVFVPLTAVGDIVKVKVIGVDLAKKRISLTMKGF